MVKLSLPGQTFSKSDYMWPSGLGRARSAVGSVITLEDWRVLIDCSMGLGSTILGHGDARVTSAITEVATRGANLSRPHILERDVADRLGAVFPKAESVRFFTSGSEACQAAVRLARAWTKQSVVFFCGYHGWHDWYAQGSSLSAGATQVISVHPMPYNNLDWLKDQVRRMNADEFGPAAVILEPFRVTEPDPAYLKTLCEWCRERGIVTIFDESITWPRVHKGGARAEWQADPDLIVLSKALGNGVPVAALMGRSEIMDQRVLVSPTFGGNAVSLAAANATLAALATHDVSAHLDRLGRALLDEIEDVRWARVVGRPCWLHMQFEHIPSPDDFADPIVDKDVIRTRWIDLMVERRVLTQGQFMFSLAHTGQQIGEIAEAYNRVARMIDREIEDGTIESKVPVVLRPILTHVYRP
jgi:glutamate-1-semialdehyde aminotransferase